MKVDAIILCTLLLTGLMGCGSQPILNATEAIIIVESPSSVPTMPTPTEDAVLLPSPTADTTRIPPTPLPPRATTSPMPTGILYCDNLFENYTPAEGYKLYCDRQYEYAFEYPLGWEVEGLDRPTPDPTAFPEAYSQVLQFFQNNYANQIYINTGIMPEGSSLLDMVQNQRAYEDRAFKKDYSPTRIGGKMAYGFVNRHVQDYNGVTLFFEHGKHYTVMYMKIITRAGLDVDWEIARSIQVPGTSPVDNVISDELIKDSYRLLW